MADRGSLGKEMELSIGRRKVVWASQLPYASHIVLMTVNRRAARVFIEGNSRTKCFKV